MGIGRASNLRLVGPALISAVVVLLPACGSDSSGEAPGGASGTAGSQGGGGSSGGGAGGSSGGGAGVSGAAADCSQIAAPVDGSVQDIIVPRGSRLADDVFAACDGSFVVSGESLEATAFERQDGSLIELPQAPYWVARFDAEGKASWAQAISSGDTGGAGRWSYVTSFDDGSVAMAGQFGVTATFGMGEPSETTLTSARTAPEGFIARYDASGRFQWVRQIGPAPDSFVWGVSAGADGRTFATVATDFAGGLVLGPGEIDVSLEDRDGALVALTRDGQFEHAVRYTNGVFEAHVRVLADGDVVLLGVAGPGTIVAKGSPEEVELTEQGLFVARFSAELALKSVHVIDVPAGAYGSALLPDGSLVSVGTFGGSLTLGAGEPNEVTFTNPHTDQDGFVARFDSAGKLVWAAQLAGEHNLAVYTVAATSDGSAWVVGQYSGVGPGALVLAPGTPEALTLSTQSQPAFLARFTPQGKPAWVVPIDADRYLHPIAASASPESLLVIGEFQGTMQFATTGETATTPGQSVFIARLGP